MTMTLIGFDQVEFVFVARIHETFFWGFAGHVRVHESCLPQHDEYRGTSAIWSERCGIIQVIESYSMCMAWE